MRDGIFTVSKELVRLVFDLPPDLHIRAFGQDYRGDLEIRVRGDSIPECVDGTAPIRLMPVYETIRCGEAKLKYIDGLKPKERV